MSQWNVFEELVVSEEYRNAGRKLASELRHAHHLPGEPLAIPIGKAGAIFSLWCGKMVVTISRWSGKILVTSGERLLRYAG